jgi:hypothetical protein
VKAISVSAELLVIQRAVQGVADILDVENVGHPVSDDAQRQAVATLNLVAVRLRDLGRAARGRMPVELFWAPHNAALDTKAANEEDVILYEPVPTGGKGKK